MKVELEYQENHTLFCVAGLTSKTPTGCENCSLLSMILSNSLRNVSYCYCCYQLRQQRRLAIMTSKHLK